MSSLSITIAPVFISGLKDNETTNELDPLKDLTRLLTLGIE